MRPEIGEKIVNYIFYACLVFKNIAVDKQIVLSQLFCRSSVFDYWKLRTIFNFKSIFNLFYGENKSKPNLKF